MIRALFLVCFLCLGAAYPAAAQTLRVTAGEHPSFTRLVIRVPPGTDWRFDGVETARNLVVGDDSLRFDTTALFDRIPRTRLVEAMATPGALALTLACDCPHRIWLERPDLLVLDILDPDLETQLRPIAAEIQVPASTPDVTLDLFDIARLAGEQLANSNAPRDEQVGPTPPSAYQLAVLAQGLGETFAQALGEGVLESEVGDIASPVAVLPPLDRPELPLNVEVDRDTAEGNTVHQEPDSRFLECQGAERLEALIVLPDRPFSEAFGALAQTLVGEFDQPVPSVYEDLIFLYLASGFGAEARALLDNVAEPLAGRDFLLGFSDILEGRSTNSRLRLATAQSCGRVAALGALLAGTTPSPLETSADDLALTFGQLPSAMRAILAPQLVDHLLAQTEIDAARIVAEAMEHSGLTDRATFEILRANIDRALGRTHASATRLADLPLTTFESMHVQIALARETNEELSSEFLEDAAAIASENRNSDGASLMASIALLHAANGDVTKAFAALDLIETWLRQQPSLQSALDETTNSVWGSLARNSDDQSFLVAILGRGDWTSDSLDGETERYIMRRLADLGFSEATSSSAEVDTAFAVSRQSAR